MLDHKMPNKVDLHESIPATALVFGDYWPWMVKSVALRGPLEDRSVCQWLIIEHLPS